MSRFRVKRCLAPECEIYTETLTNKVFFPLPKNEVKLNEWLNALGREKFTRNGYVCEDHFDLEQDLENPLKYRLMGPNILRPPKLKDDVVPHLKISYQPASKRKKSDPKSKNKQEPLHEPVKGMEFEPVTVMASTNKLPINNKSVHDSMDIDGIVKKCIKRHQSEQNKPKIVALIEINSANHEQEKLEQSPGNDKLRNTPNSLKLKLKLLKMKLASPVITVPEAQEECNDILPTKKSEDLEKSMDTLTQKSIQIVKVESLTPEYETPVSNSQEFNGIVKDEPIDLPTNNVGPDFLPAFNNKGLEEIASEASIAILESQNLIGIVKEEPEDPLEINVRPIHRSIATEIDNTTDGFVTNNQEKDINQRIPERKSVNHDQISRLDAFLNAQIQILNGPYEKEKRIHHGSQCNEKTQKILKCHKSVQAQAKCYSRGTNCSLDPSEKNIKVKKKRTPIIMQVMKQNLSIFLGIPKGIHYCIELLRNRVLSRTEMMITLRKIYLNESFEELALYFRMESKEIKNRIFKCAQKMSGLLKGLMFRRNCDLPSTGVQLVIDSFEVQIEKSTDPTTLTLTYSPSKCCNTIKYLISMTPDGVINYVSEGYAGRTDDKVIFQESGLLERVTGTVLALNGFYGLSDLLEERGYDFIRPSYVSEVNCAAICDCAEQIIKKVRKFAMVSYNTCVSSDISFKDMNSVVVIVCGLVNFETQLKLGRKYTYVES